LCNRSYKREIRTRRWSIIWLERGRILMKEM
jgi:hypothetical protein